MKGCQKMAGLNKVTVDDIDVKGKRVLARCDFNVPLMDGEITNDKRMRPYGKRKISTTRTGNEKDN